MSIKLPDKQVSNAQPDAQLTRTVKERRFPNRGRVKKALPTTTIWGLEAILDAAKEGREIMEDMLRWIDRERIDAKGRYDSARLIRLGELAEMVAGLGLRVGKTERFAADARIGIYEGPNRTGNGTRNDAKPQ